MERHPARCQPSYPSSRPRSTPKSLSHYVDLLAVPGIQSAITTLQHVSADVVHPVTKYNRYTYLNRFNTAVSQLADSFIQHVNQIRKQRIQAYNQRYDYSSDDSLVVRRRSSRPAKRPRPSYFLSDDEHDRDYFPGRKILPKRSKEIRGNLNDDLAYTLMEAQPEPHKPLHKRLKPASPPRGYESEDESEEEIDEDEIAASRVVRPLPFVRKRPLASDNMSLTPFIDEDDDSTDTEIQRRDHARRSLKTVIYGPGNAQFTDKEIALVFPTRSKRRMISDSIVTTTSRPRPTAYAPVPNGTTAFHPVIARLSPIPKDMIARFINGSYRLSTDPFRDLDVFPHPNGLGFWHHSDFHKQRFPSSDRETRCDSAKASPTAGSSTTGSPRAKRPDLQNGHMEIQLGPSLSSINDAPREEHYNGAAVRRANGKIHRSSGTWCRAWKDFAPYGKVPQPHPPPQPRLPQPPARKLEPARTPTASHPYRQHSSPPTSRKQPTAGNNNPQRETALKTIAKQYQSTNAKTETHSQNPPQAASTARSLAGGSKTGPPKPRMASRENPSTSVLARSSQVSVKPSPGQQRNPQVQKPSKSPQMSSSSPNQMTVVARAAPAMSLAMHQMSVQPHLNLQPQQTILTAVPVPVATQHALQLQQYAQDPRLLSQWQLQNALQQAPGTVSLPPGFVSVNSVVTPAPPSPFPVQSRFVSVPTGVPIATNALVTAPAMRQDVMGVQPNGVGLPAAAEPVQPEFSSPSTVPSGRQGNFNSQLQEQYHKHYEEMYAKHYQEHMNNLKRGEGRNGTS